MGILVCAGGNWQTTLQASSPAARLLCCVTLNCKRGALLAAGRIRKFAVVCNKQNPRRAFSLPQRCKCQARSTRRGASTTSLTKERLVCEYLHYVVSAMPRATSAERAETNEKRVICRRKMIRTLGFEIFGFTKNAFLIRSRLFAGYLALPYFCLNDTFSLCFQICSSANGIIIVYLKHKHNPKFQKAFHLIKQN